MHLLLYLVNETASMGDAIMKKEAKYTSVSDCGFSVIIITIVIKYHRRGCQSQSRPN